jgi:hypothetical protein
MSAKPGCLGTLARLIAVALALIFVFTLPVTLLARNTANVLFSPEVVARIVSARLLDTGALRQAAVEAMLSAQTSTPGAGTGMDLQQALALLTPRDRDTIVNMLLPDGWVREQIGSITEGLYAWLDNSEPLPAVSVDMQSIKDRLLGGGAGRMAEIVVSSWPTCSVEQLGALAEAPGVPGSESFPFCQPPEPYRSSMIREATSKLTEVAANIPASMPIAFGEPPRDPSQVLAIKQQIRMLRFFARWGVFVPLSLLGLIMALVIRSWRGLARWWGVPFLVGGALSLAPLLAGPALNRQLLQGVAAMGGVPPAVAEMLRGVGSGLIDAVLRPQGWQASLIGGLGLALVLASLFLGQKAPLQPPLASPPSSAPSQPALSPPSTSAPPPVAPHPGAPPKAKDKKDTPSGMFG